MVARSFALVAAIRIGANVAPLFAMGLIAWKSHLDEQHIVRTEAWARCGRRSGSAGKGGRRWAINCLEELALRFAKASSAMAIALAGTALVMSGELYSDIRRRCRPNSGRYSVLGAI